MNDSIILSNEELVLLTGKRRASAQEKVLIALGIYPRKRPDGTIVVLRSDLYATQKAATRTPALRLN